MTRRLGCAQARTKRLMRGVSRLPDPAICGAVIGAVGACVFVNAYRGLLPQHVSLTAMALWLVELVVFAWALLVRPRLFPEPGPVPGALRWCTSAESSGCSRSSRSVGSCWTGQGAR